MHKICVAYLSRTCLENMTHYFFAIKNRLFRIGSFLFILHDAFRHGHGGNASVAACGNDLSEVFVHDVAGGVDAVGCRHAVFVHGYVASF